MNVVYLLVGFTLGLAGFWGIGISLFVCLRAWSTSATGAIAWAMVGILSFATSALGVYLISLGE